MGLINQFGLKRKIIKLGSEGIDRVKKGMTYYLISKCKESYNQNYLVDLVSAVVNAVFSENPTDENGIKFLKNNDNIINVHSVIETYVKKSEVLKKLITDAVRVKSAILLESKFIKSNTKHITFARKPIEKIKRLGILVAGGDFPDILDFIEDASNFLKECQKNFFLGKNTDLSSISKKIKNLPFEYLTEKYSIDLNPFQLIADILYKVAQECGIFFSDKINLKVTERIVHYFFDFYLINVIPAFFPDHIRKNKDIFSALIDGIHFEFFGNISNVHIKSNLELMITRDEDCFFHTLADSESSFYLLTSLALYCVNCKETGAIYTLEIASILNDIFIAGKKLLCDYLKSST